MYRSTTHLPRHLALAYGLLVVYACLHPFADWHESGLAPLDFLSAPWPRYYRVNDMVLNVLGFVPLGFLIVPALPRGLRLGACVAASCLRHPTPSGGIPPLRECVALGERWGFRDF